MEAPQILSGSHSPRPFTFVVEIFPPELHQQKPQPGSQPAPQVEAPQIDMIIAEHPPPASEFSQDFYTEANTRRVQPPRARRTDFGKHTADELIIDAIERAEKEKPVIPPETVFFCTTDNSMMPNMHEVLTSIHPAGTESADELPMHSYFRDPEVMRKIRSQEMIETPSWREATREDWEEAYLEIPEPWRNIPPDTSLEYYRRSHIKLERMEAMVRNREKAKLAHDYHHLKARLVELQQLDVSGFRGETLAEQEQDKILVLAAAKKLLENQRVKGKVEDKDIGDGAEDGIEEAKDEDGTAPSKANTTKPPRKKKESKWQYYPADFDLDGEIIGDTSKKKKPKKKPPVRSDRAGSGASKKRKRDDMEMELDEIFAEDLVLEPEGEEDEYLEGAERLASLKKAKALSAPRRSIAPARNAGFPNRDKEKDEKASKLLDFAKRFNPKRPPRDLHPFGAPLPELEVVDFDLPPWLRWKLDVGDADVATPTATVTAMQADEPADTPIPTMEMKTIIQDDPSFPGIQQGPTEPLEEVPEADDAAADFMEAIFDPRVPQSPLRAGKSFLMTEDAESSGLSDLTDEDEGTNTGGEVATLDEQDEGVDAMEEEDGEADVYPPLKPIKQRRGAGRASTSKGKKARRR